MRPLACTVAQRTPVVPTNTTNTIITAMPKDIYRLKRAQLIHYPRATKPLGPITLLPLELLTHVFLSCVQDGDDEDHSGSSSNRSSNVPLILSQVCSSWRKSVLKLPQLWTHLNINLTAHTMLPSTSPFITAHSSSQSHLSKSPEALANLTSLWFERARNQLLSVSIKLTAMSTTAVQDASSFVQPILSNAKSIRNLSIHASSHTQLAQFFSRSDAEFTNLESLSLSIRHFDHSSSSSSLPITTFTHSPRLTRVYFDLNNSPPSPSMIHLPWSHLEQFTMSGTSLLPADECRTLLSTCTNLRKASVWVDDSIITDTASTTTTAHSDSKTPTTTLPHLTHLSLSFYGRHPKTPNSLLTSFDLPHLQHLHLFSGFITLPFIPPITSRHLSSLSLSGVDVSAAQLANLARVSSSSLHSLALDLRYCSGDIPAIANVLAADDPRVFPYLSNLSIWTRHISPNSTSYSQLIRSRSCNPHTSLRLDLYLARQRHERTCCPPPRLPCPKSNNDNNVSLIDVCEKATGVVLRIKDVRLDEGITDISF